MPINHRANTTHYVTTGRLSGAREANCDFLALYVRSLRPRCLIPPQLARSGAFSIHHRSFTDMLRALLSLALVASASAFGGVSPAPVTSKLSMSRLAARTPVVEMQASSKSTVIGAAAVGGIVGVYFFHELQTGLILAAILAYASTTASQFGNAAETAGETAVKVYDKTLELNAQYDLLPKVGTCPFLWPPCRPRVSMALPP